MGRYEDTVEHFELAASLLSSDHTALNLLALAHRSLGRRGEFEQASYRALERIEREVSVRPDNANAIAHGALALARLGEKERAEEWVDRALIIEPDDAIDQYNLACALAQIGQVEKALDLLETCIPKMPEEFDVWLARDPDLDPIRTNPRYAELGKRIGNKPDRR